VAEIHITLRKHLAKEETQLLPLLLQHFSAAEQAELVAQFLYCIPLDTVERVLSWLKPTVPMQELQELMNHLRDVIPDRLLLQLLVTWLNPVQPRPPSAAGQAGAAAAAALSAVPTGVADAAGAHAAAVAAAVAAADAGTKPGQERMIICPFAAGATKQQGLLFAGAAALDTAGSGAAAAAAGSGGCSQQQWPPLRVSRPCWRAGWLVGVSAG
jgi:zinc finger-like protein